VTRIAPPASRMGPLTPDEQARLMQTAQVREYATAIDRESAREILARRLEATAPTPPAPREEEPTPQTRQRPAPREKGMFEDLLHSPLARHVAGQVTRDVMGVLLGRTPRRRRR
jgi:hypothetical protein